MAHGRSNMWLSYGVAVFMVWTAGATMHQSEAQNTLSAQRYSHGLAPVRVKGQFGFIDYVADIKIQPQYQWCGSFSDGLAAVLVNDKVGYIDTNGQMAIPASFEPAYNISSRLGSWYLSEIRGFVSGLYAFREKDGNISASPMVMLANEFSEGAVGVKKDGKYGFIDRLGQVIVPFGFEWVGPFREGCAIVRVGKTFGMIDKTGKFIIPADWDSLTEMSCGALTGVANGKWYVIKKDGGTVEIRGADSVSTFSDGLAMVRIGNKAGYIDRDGDMAIAPSFDAVGAGVHRGGLAIISAAGMAGFVDLRGKMVIKPQFEAASWFCEGLAAVFVKDKGWGYVDRSGGWAIEPQFALAHQFSGGLALVEKAGVLGSIGYIAHDGRKVWEAQK